MDGKSGIISAIATIIIIFILIISLAVYGWSTLPQHDAQAEAATALIPYLQQQEQIRTDALAVAAQRKAERAAAAQPYQTTAAVAGWVALSVVALSISGSVIVASYSKTRRIVNQDAMPTLQVVGENHVLLGDGANAHLLNLATGQHQPAFAAVAASDTYAQIMARVLVARELGQAAANVAKHTKDPATADYLLGQIEDITHATKPKPARPTPLAPIPTRRSAQSTIIPGHQSRQPRPGNSNHAD